MVKGGTALTWNNSEREEPQFPRVTSEIGDVDDSDLCKVRDGSQFIPPPHRSTSFLDKSELSPGPQLLGMAHKNDNQGQM